MAANFTPERAAAIERALVDHVARRAPRTKHKTWAAGLLLTGALAGAGASAGAFAATGMLQPPDAPVAQHPEGQPTPDLPDPVAAPEGTIPGSSIISLLGEEPVSLTIDSATEVSLQDRPAEATHARVTITPTRPGALSWGTDPGGNNPTAAWTSADFSKEGPAATWQDLALDTSVDTLYLDPLEFAGVVTVQYVAHLPTVLATNDRGQTYGTTGSAEGKPDLIEVEATNGKLGYVYREELDKATGETAAQDFTTPQDALEWQEENRGKTHTLPVYLSDGTSQIGEFHIGSP
ncbi:hypothetical protein [Georgenia satyanarayanai]|uniref:hypothetical protein n=1 Tax=Georgenia satyanarayanai TaxID=860221 RepID=UPI00203C333B|nr:hypothetical protein [Georgenia satyanarayanai]